MRPFRLTSHLMTADHICCHHVDGLRTILADRERELLDAKGPCRNDGCRLHCAHSGPCDAHAENGD